MKRLRALLCALALVIAGTPVASAASAINPIWWELEPMRMGHASKSSMAGMQALREMPRKLSLRRGEFPYSRNALPAPWGKICGESVSVWIKSPEGVVSKAEVLKREDAVALDLPLDLNAGNVTGRFLVGVHVDAGVMDLDSDGTDERVHLYSNYMIRHYKHGGVEGEEEAGLFMDPDKMALEIGPVIDKRILKRAGSPASGAMDRGKRDVGYVWTAGLQTPFREGKMKVIYKGRPLADTEITILTRSGWKKAVKTDPDGVFSIVLPKTRALPSASKMSPMRGQTDKRPGKDSRAPGGTGKGEENDRDRGKNAVGPAGPRMTENARNSMVKDANRAFYESMFRIEDELLYMVAHRDLSTGEYHCATMPMPLESRVMGKRFQDEWRSRSKGFTLWGIMGVSLGIVGITGGIYRKMRRDRETICEIKRLSH